MNNLVQYLNTQHRKKGNNDNSIAEKNLTDPIGKTILVKNDEEITTSIYNELSKRGGKYILTGCAGDGKTTLASQILKRIVEDYNLEEIELIDRTEFRIEDKRIIIIKDFSELKKDTESEAAFITADLLDENCSILLVSNTGTLLDFFTKNHAILSNNQLSKLDIENKVLTAISAKQPLTDLEVSSDLNFKFTNLSQVNNLPLAKKLLYNIINHKEWSHCCSNCLKNTNCPIYYNVRALKEIPLVVERIFNIYERMYEYNSRYTMRNFIEHFAFFITGGLECDSLEINSKLSFKNLFSNLFFGNSNEDLQIAIINDLSKADLGQNLPPLIIRKSWTYQTDTNNDIIPNRFFEDISENLKNRAISLSSRNYYYRLLFFSCSSNSAENLKFRNSFLNAPGFYIWKSCQKGKEALDTRTIQWLKTSVIHVVKEYFAGVKLPQNDNVIDNKIYITINRNRKEILQSSQVVLRELNINCFDIQIEQNSKGIFDLFLYMNPNQNTAPIKLKLSLPFLDFIIRQHYGLKVNQDFIMYQKRLDIFKNQILQSEKINNDEKNEMLLVKLEKNNNTIQLSPIKFKLKKIDAQNTTLEVFNE